MSDPFTPQIRAAASQAGTLLAGAFDTPTVTADKANAAFEKLGITNEKLGIASTGKVLFTVTYSGCQTHNFVKLEEAAKVNGAKLVVIYGRPEYEIDRMAYAQKDGNGKSKLTIGIATGRSLDADIRIAIKDPKTKTERFLTASEVSTLASDLGLTLDRSDTIGLSSSNSAYYNNGKFIGVIANGAVKKLGDEPPAPSKKAELLPRTRSTVALG